MSELKDVCVVSGVNSEGHEWVDAVHEDADAALASLKKLGISSHTIHYDEKDRIESQLVTLRNKGERFMLRPFKVNYDNDRPRIG